MNQRPFATSVLLAKQVLSAYDNHVIRRLSALRGHFLDWRAYEAILSTQDPVIYHVYEVSRPEVEGELMYGLSIVLPGKVGDEYLMTKGHFHTVLSTAEVYYCLKGEGMMVMETPEGDWSVEELRPGSILYVPPRWAHRSVNTGSSQDLVTLFIYPANAGHDYGTIEQQGFRKLIVERDGRAQIVDNPRWRARAR